MDQQTVRVHLNKVTNIPPLPKAEDSFQWCGGKRDPYVVIELNAQEHMSSVRPRSLNPEWHEEAAIFDFHVPASEWVSSIMNIMIYDFLNHDSLLGTTAITLGSLKFNEMPQAFMVKSKVQNGRPQAKCKVWLRLEILSSLVIKTSMEPKIVLEMLEQECLLQRTEDASEKDCGYLGKRFSRFSSMDGFSTGDQFENVAAAVPCGWSSEKGWHVILDDDSDSNGWVYARTLDGPWTKIALEGCRFRRRKWENTCYQR
jgi:hypothetical protein